MCAGTWAAYSRFWAEWEDLFGVLRLDHSDYEVVLLYFIGKAYGCGVSSVHLGRSLSAMAFWFKLRGFTDYTKSFLVHQVVRGFRKGAQVCDLRRPVSYDLLVWLGSILVDHCFSQYEFLLFKCAFALAFFGAFCISELVAPSRTREGGLRHEDVRSDGSVLCCLLHRSKIYQTGRGTVVWVGRAGYVSSASFLVLYLRPVESAPLLVHADGYFLSRFHFVQVFRQRLVGLGFEARAFSSHSFHIGAAAKAAR